MVGRPWLPTYTEGWYVGMYLGSPSTKKFIRTLAGIKYWARKNPIFEKVVDEVNRFPKLTAFPKFQN